MSLPHAGLPSPVIGSCYKNGQIPSIVSTVDGRVIPSRSATPEPRDLIPCVTSADPVDDRLALPPQSISRHPQRFIFLGDLVRRHVPQKGRRPVISAGMRQPVLQLSSYVGDRPHVLLP